MVIETCRIQPGRSVIATGVLCMKLLTADSNPTFISARTSSTCVYVLHSYGTCRLYACISSIDWRCNQISIGMDRDGPLTDEMHGVKLMIAAVMQNEMLGI